MERGYTGVRDITGLLAGVTAGIVTVSRDGSTVVLTFQDVKLAAASQTLAATTPADMSILHPGSGVIATAISQLNTVAIRAAITAAGIIKIYNSSTTDIHNGVLTFHTTPAWGTALPGGCTGDRSGVPVTPTEYAPRITRDGAFSPLVLGKLTETFPTRVESAGLGILPAYPGARTHKWKSPVYFPESVNLTAFREVSPADCAAPTWRSCASGIPRRKAPALPARRRGSSGNGRGRSSSGGSSARLRVLSSLTLLRVITGGLCRA